MNRPVDRGMKPRRSSESRAGDAQSFLQLHLLAHRGRALAARGQMGGKILLRLRFQLVIHVQSDLVPPLTTHDFLPAVCKMYSRTCFRARASRDITVPIGMVRASATSW